MTLEEIHKEIHVKLHQSLDELVADFIMQTENKPSNTTILELIQWSAKQMTNPISREEQNDS